MTRYRVSLELDHGFSVEGEVRRLLRARRDADAHEPRPLMPGERSSVPLDTYVPEQLSTADGAVAAWVYDNATLRDPALAFAVIRQAPDVDAFPSCQPSPFYRDGGLAAIEDLRAGKPVATSIVVRIACHMLETTP